MKSFDIQSSLDDIYARYPEATRQRVIGLTGNFADGDARLCEQYYMSVVRAGGTPVIIPPVADKDVIINTLDKIDGLVLTGGGDINPLGPVRSLRRACTASTTCATRPSC